MAFSISPFAFFNSLPDLPRSLAISGSFLPPKRKTRTKMTISISPEPKLVNILCYSDWFNSSASSKRNKGITVSIVSEIISFGGRKAATSIRAA